MSQPKVEERMQGLIKLLMLNTHHAEDGCEALAALKCAGLSCNQCPFFSEENMDATINALEVVWPLQQ